MHEYVRTLCSYVHAYIHTHASTTLLPTCIHASICTWIYKHTQPHTYLRARTHARTLAYTHACTHARTHARTHAHTRTHTHFRVSMHVCECRECVLEYICLHSFSRNHRPEINQRSHRSLTIGRRPIRRTCTRKRRRHLLLCNLSSLSRHNSHRSRDSSPVTI